jgi:hypothetical protein
MQRHQIIAVEWPETAGSDASDMAGSCLDLVKKRRRSLRRYMGDFRKGKRPASENEVGWGPAHFFVGNECGSGERDSPFTSVSS